jgi:hypothetical protein
VDEAQRKRVDALLVALDDANAQKRERATQELLPLAVTFEPLLDDVLRNPPSAEVRNRLTVVLNTARGPERLRTCLLNLVAALDDADTEKRDKVLTELRGLVPALAQEFDERLRSDAEDMLNPPRGIRTPALLALKKVIASEPLRTHTAEVRAVTVLEGIGTPEARKVLEGWAKGAPKARLTEEAKAAMTRMGK